MKELDSAVAIEVNEVTGRRAQLEAAFAACQAGQCSCPTDEYEKLGTMEIKHGEDAIRLRLEPKPGEKFDLSEIAACLDYVTGRATEVEA